MKASILGRCCIATCSTPARLIYFSSLYPCAVLCPSSLLAAFSTHLVSSRAGGYDVVSEGVDLTVWSFHTGDICWGEEEAPEEKTSGRQAERGSDQEVTSPPPTLLRGSNSLQPLLYLHPSDSSLHTTHFKILPKETLIVWDLPEPGAFLLVVYRGELAHFILWKYQCVAESTHTSIIRSDNYKCFNKRIQKTSGDMLTISPVENSAYFYFTRCTRPVSNTPLLI